MRQRRRPTVGCTHRMIGLRSNLTAPKSDYSNSCGIVPGSGKTEPFELSVLTEPLRSIYAARTNGRWPISYWRVTMNLIKALHEHIQRTHPKATAHLTPPLDADGLWSLDGDSADKHLATQWRPATGLGASCITDENFAEAPTEVFQPLDE